MNDIAFVIETLTPEFPRAGIEPILIGRHTAGPGVEQSSPLSSMARSFLDVWRNRFCDVLHVNYGLFGPLSFGAEVPVVLHCHGDDIRPSATLKGRVANIVSQLSTRGVNEVWYSTIDLASYLVGVSVPHRYMPNPVSAGFFTTARGLPSRPSVLFAVPLSKGKGADAAIDAMRRVVQARPDLDLVSFGFGPDETEAALLRERIPKSIRLLPWTSHQAMPKVFERASVVVGQLRSGTLGITELEAMAAARAVVMRHPTSLKAVEAYYQSDPPVLAVERGDEVAAAVLDLISDTDSLERMGTRGRAWVKQHHSAPVVAQMYAAVYRNLVESSG